MTRRQIIPIFLPHAGCPNRCIFCAQALTGSRKSRPDPLEISSELERLLPQQGDGELAFYGGSFTLLTEAEQQIWLEIGTRFIAAGRVATIRISTRPDAISINTVERLVAAGVTTVELGCQSFDDEVLSCSGRGHGAAAAGFAVAALRAKGIAVGIHLMPGLPGSTPDEAFRSCDEALRLHPDFLRIHPTVVLRGTALADLYLSGRYKPLALTDAVVLCAHLLRKSHAAGIPVIRTGIQGNQDLDSGNAIIAGPYHPAFGQLVRSRLWFDCLAALGGGGYRSFHVHPSDLGDALGHRRSNYMQLKDRFGALVLQCAPDVPRETVEYTGLRASLYQERL